MNDVDIQMHEARLSANEAEALRAESQGGTPLSELTVHHRRQAEDAACYTYGSTTAAATAELAELGYDVSDEGVIFDILMAAKRRK